MKRFSIQILTVFSLLMVLAATSFAQHGGDIEVTIEGNKIVTNSRVYGAELGLDSPYQSTEPGYDAIPGTFGPSATVGFDILGSLKVWNGVDFSTPATTRLLLGIGSGMGRSEVLTPTTNIFLAGLSRDATVGGEWHRHFDMTLVNSDTTALPPPSPGPTDYAQIGVYLLELQLRTNQSGIQSSLPYFLVINNGDTEINHAAATAYQSAVAAVPEPGTWALLVCGLGAVSFWGGKKLRRPIPAAC